MYREITAQDAFGNIETALLNDCSLNGQYLYHGKTGQMLSSTVSNVGTPLHQLSYTLYDSYGNLKTQENTQTGATDEFTYDSLHRLTQSDLTINSVTDTIEYGYDAVGNITKKSDYSQNTAGAYQYTNGTNQISQITLKDASVVTYGYDNKGNQTHRNGTQEVTYNVFNKPVSITKNSSNIQLFYGADIMRYKQIRVVDSKTITTHYIDKHYEVEIDENNNQTRKSYISDVAIITDSDTDGHSISFTHRDRLGSAATFTDHNNQIVATRHFDPFGKPRAGDWSQLEKLGLRAQLRDNPQDSLMDTRRGFTDHEHLDEAELIHMNGRVYDYNVGRFMSVDPLIQGAANSQSINPYSYILNNPMSGTDPTGYARIPKRCAKLNCDNSAAVPLANGFLSNNNDDNSDNGASQQTDNSGNNDEHTDLLGQEGVNRKREANYNTGSTFNEESPEEIERISVVCEGDECNGNSDVGDNVLYADSAAIGFLWLLAIWEPTQIGKVILGGIALAILMTTPGDSDQSNTHLNMRNASESATGGPDDEEPEEDTGPFKTDKEAAAQAERLGFKKIKERSHGQAIFKKGNKYITRDVDGHNGGAWKMANSVRNLGRRETRMGTYSRDLKNRIGN